MRNTRWEAPPHSKIQDTRNGWLMWHLPENYVPIPWQGKGVGVGARGILFCYVIPPVICSKCNLLFVACGFWVRRMCQWAKSCVKGRLSLLIPVQKCLLASWQQCWSETPPLFILPIKMLGLQALAFTKSVKLNSGKSQPKIKCTQWCQKKKKSVFPHCLIIFSLLSLISLL